MSVQSVFFKRRSDKIESDSHDKYVASLIRDMDSNTKQLLNAEMAKTHKNIQ